MTTTRVFPGASTESRSDRFTLNSTSSTTRRDAGSTRVPPSIPRGQRYFWTRLWQVGEEESRADLERGESRRFNNSLDAVRWLLSDDE